MRLKPPNSLRLQGGADARPRARRRNIVLQVPDNKSGAAPCERLLKIFTIACTLLLFYGGPNYYSPRSFKSIWDLGHIVLFAALGSILLLEWSKNKKMSFRRQIVAVILISLVLGALIEWAQAGTHRNADVLDVLRDLVGTLVAVSFFAPANKTLPKSYRRTLQAATLLMVSFAVFPFVKAVADESLARTQFPVLSDFETPFEIDRWAGKATLSIDNTIHYSGKSSLKVAFNTSTYSGAHLQYFPGNWSRYQYLRFNIFNPQKETLNIICRIHDRHHTAGHQEYGDRFNKNYTLKEGWNLIDIPLEEVAKAPRNRQLDLKEVQEIGLFAYRLSRPRIINIDDVRLANKSEK